MARTWLLIDSNFMCWRAAYTMGDLQHAGQATGVIYGFFKDILYVQERFSTHHVAFCFDFGKPLRCQSYPSYKQQRKKTEGDRGVFRLSVSKQIRLLRTEILPDLGHANVFFSLGYESDDLIAAIVGKDSSDEYVVVSSDKDLLQLLSPKVCCYNPTKRAVETPESFKRQYGIDPVQWPCVKAIAGCHSDNVKGVRGVGEKTAIKLLKGEIPVGSAIYNKFKAGEEVWKGNLPLVKLPFAGTPEVTLTEYEQPSDRKWKEVLSAYGITSLKNYTPTNSLFGIT